MASTGATEVKPSSPAPLVSNRMGQPEANQSRSRGRQMDTPTTIPEQALWAASNSPITRKSAPDYTQFLPELLSSSPRSATMEGSTRGQGHGQPRASPRSVEIIHQVGD